MLLGSLFFLPSTCVLMLEWMDHLSGTEFLPEAVPHEVLCLSAVQAPVTLPFHLMEEIRLEEMHKASETL